MNAPVVYTTTEVRKMAGISYRRADYYVRKGWIRVEGGKGSGDPREWDADAVVVALALADVARACGTLPSSMGKMVADEVYDTLQSGGDIATWYGGFSVVLSIDVDALKKVERSYRVRVETPV